MYTMKPFLVRMNEEEYNDIKSKAKAANLSMSRYVVLKARDKLKV